MRKPIARLVLHIGTEKTGTTTLQAFLALNRDLFLQHGVAIPGTLGKANHLRLPAYAEAFPWRLGQRHFGLRDEAGHAAFRERVAADLVAELGDCGSSQCIVSSEHLHSRIRSVREIAEVASLLRRVATQIRVLVYFRRQDLMAVSRYSTALAAGSVAESPFTFRGSRRNYYDYAASFSNWAQVFGAGQVDARIFSARMLLRGSLIEDFCHAAGVPFAASFAQPPDGNVSPGSDALSLIRELNLQVREGGLALPEEQRRRAVKRIVALYPSETAYPPRAEARAFLDSYARSNARLAELIGLDAKSPFDDDFSMYPEAIDADRLPRRRAWARKELPRVLQRTGTPQVPAPRWKP